MTFYDDLAGQYDDLTDTAGRARDAERFVSALLERFPVRSAIDVACGTGVYTLPLAAAGVQCVGADLSSGMLDEADRRAQAAGLTVQWVCAPMQSLADRIDGRFDTVLCMGNSIPHLLDSSELAATLQGFVRLLNPGGVAIVQWLHYDRVLADRERIVGIDRFENRRYVRFYDFLDDGRLRFNVLTLTDTPNRIDHALHEAVLAPWTVSAVTDAMAAAGFNDVQPFGGLDFSPLRDDSSTVLVSARVGATSA